jgi:hypothetical protein
MAMDLGEGGAKLASSECFPLESLVLLDLDARTRLRAVERIAWAAQTDREDRWRVGVEFTDLSEDTRSQLRQILRRPQAGD